MYPLKTLENVWFSDVFRGYEKGRLALNEIQSTDSLVWLQKLALNHLFFI